MSLSQAQQELLRKFQEAIGLDWDGVYIDNDAADFAADLSAVLESPDFPYAYGPARSEKAVLQSLNLRNDVALAAFASHAASLPDVRTLDMAFSPVTDDGMAHVAKFTHLRTIELAYTNVTDAGLKHLADLSNLEALRLHGTRVTNAGMIHLQGLSKLRTLHLEGTSENLEGVANLAKTGLRELRWDANPDDAAMAQLAKILTLEKLVLCRARVTHAGLAHLASLPNLRSLDLAHASIHDEGLAYLSQIPRLEALHIKGTWVTDAGLAHLAKCMNLRSLDLSNTRVAGAGLAHLVELPLESLILIQTPITDAALVHVGKLKALKHLMLYGTRVTDAGVASLDKLAALESLDLSQTHVTNAGLSRLGELRNLKDLSLQQTKVGNAGLVHLAKLQSLRILDLSQARATRAGLVALAQLPALRVLHCQGSSLARDIFAGMDATRRGRLMEATLLVVGPSRVGKTSLIKRLAFDPSSRRPFDPHEPPSVQGVVPPWPGIKVELRSSATADDADAQTAERAIESITLHVLEYDSKDERDMGCLLHQPALCLVALDATKTLEENQADAFLKLVRRFERRHSSETSSRWPVVVVVTQSDAFDENRRDPNIATQGTPSRDLTLPALLAARTLEGKPYGNTAAVVAVVRQVSAKFDDNLEALREALLQALGEHLSDAIQRPVEGLPETSEPGITQAFRRWRSKLSGWFG